ncbi:MAG: hypothetical protein RIB98_09745 [Acidimicrobiales bacterium]
MNEPDDLPADESPLDEVREAAGAVIASLRRLLEVTERVVEDPNAFAEVVEGGRAFVEGFVGGFAATADPNAHGGEADAES